MFGKKQFLLLLFCIFGFLSLAGLFAFQTEPAQAAAGINPQVNFQARLLTVSGATVPDGLYNIRFKVYQDGDGCVSGGSSPCSGTLKWTENRIQTDRVTVTNGYFSVMLGSVTAFGSSVDWNQDTLWLSVDIGGTANTPTPTYDGEMLPFKRLGANPYAFNAQQLGGMTASQFIQLAPSAAQTDSSNSNPSIYINKTGSANLLNLQSAGTDVLTLSNTGAVLFQNSSDSTTGFQIQDADGGTSIFSVDTTNERVGIGDSAPDFRLDVAGDIRIQGTNKLFFGGTGSGDNDVNLYRNGANELKTDDYLFSAAQIAAEQGGAAQTRIGAVGPSGQSAIVFGFDNANPVNLYRSAADTLKTDDYFVQQNSSDSTTAFQIQDADGGTSIFNVDTTNERVGIGNDTPLTKLNVGEYTDSAVSIGLGNDGAAANYGLAAFNNHLKLVAPTGFRFVTGSASGTEVATITTNGAATFKNSTNSTTGFQIQNAAGTSNLFVADTTNTRIGIGTNAPEARLHVSGGHILLDNNWYLQAKDGGGSINNVLGLSGNDLNLISGSNGTGLLNSSQADYLFYVSNSGAASFQNTSNSTAAFQVQNSGSTDLLTVDTTNSRINVGESDTTGALLVLDTKTDSGDPSGTNGAMYYNADSEKFRCFEDSAWKDCIGGGAGGGVEVGGIMPYGGSSAPSGWLIADGSAVSRAAYADLFTIIGTSYGAGDGSTTFNLPDFRGRDAVGAGTGVFTGTISSVNTGTEEITVTSNNSLYTGAAVLYDTTSGAIGGLTDNTTYYAIRVSATVVKLATTRANAVAGTAINLTSSGSGTQTLTLTFSTLALGGIGGEEEHSLTIEEMPSHSHSGSVWSDTPTAAGGSFLGQGGTTVNSGATGGSGSHQIRNPYTVVNYIIRYDSTGGGNTPTSLQNAYNEGNTITTTDARDITFTLADTATDSNFIINMQGAGDFKVQDNGTDVFTINDDGTALFKNVSNSTTAFQIQDASAGSLALIDSTNANITLNGLNTGLLQSWATDSDSLPAVRAGQSIVTYNGYAYSIGGGGNSNMAPSAAIYYTKLNSDGSVNAWTSSSVSLPTATRLHTSVVANGFVYVIGGDDDNSSPFSTVYYSKLNADGSLGAWSTAASLPSAVTQATSVVANGYVYVMGGCTDGAAHNSCTPAVSTVYYSKLNADGSVGAWQTSSNALPAAVLGATSVTANGYVYVMGGSSGSATVSTVYYAQLNTDGSVGTWSTNANALTAARTASSSIVANGYIYVIGGSTSIGMGNATSAVYYAALNADGSTGTWSTNTNTLPANRENITSVVVNGYVYVIGGRRGNGSTQQEQTVYYSSVSRLKFGGSIDLVGLGGENLSDGGTGGSLTAGNTKVVGSLEVQGTTSLNSDLFVNGGLSVAGTNLALNSTNSGELQAWATNANSLPAARSGAGMAMANGYVYITGGETGGTPQTTVYYSLIAANGSLGTFTSTTALPAARAYHTTVAANGYLYVLGGDNSGAQVTTYYAKINPDGTVGSWNTSTDLPAGRLDHSSFTANGFVYVLGGLNGGTPQSTVYYAKLNADGSLGSWSTATALTAARGDGAAVAANGYAYYIGGDNSGAQTTVYYGKLDTDGTIDAWSTGTALPTGVSAQTAVVANGYIYSIGGNSAATVYYSALASNGSNGSWTTNGNSLPAVRNDPIAGVANGYVYAVGGNDTVNSVTTVYYSSTARLTVGGSLDLVGLGGENLSEGGTGGSLTAGNTNIVGNLGVKGSANIYEGLTVYNTINLNAPNAAAGDTLFNINNNTNNRIFTIEHMGTNFGSFVTAGGLLGLNSYMGAEWDSDRAQITATGNQNFGGPGTVGLFSTGETGTCLWNVVDSGLGGIGQITANAAASNCTAHNATSGGAGNINAIFDVDNLPVITMKVRLSVASTGVPDNDHQFFMGLTTAVSATPAADRPTNFIGFTNCSDAAGNTCDTTWRIQANDATTPAACTVSQTVSETQFATLQIKVLANNNIQFWIDSDASNGVNLQLCGTITSIGSTAAMASVLKADWEANSNASNLEIDYFRAWQDDNLPSGEEEQANLPEAPLSLEGGSTEDQQVVSDILNASTDDAIFDNNVHIGGTLFADKIKANQIEGLEVFTNQIRALGEAQSGSAVPSDSSTSNNSGSNEETEGADSSNLTLDSLNVNIATIQTSLTINGSVIAQAGLTVGGPAEFHGSTLFKGIVTFIEKTIFNNDIAFNGRTTFNSDTGGYAVIHPGQQEVEVKFERPYETLPVVAVTIKNGQFAQYAYKELTPNGFKIVVAQPVAADIEFSWTALSISNPKVSQLQP